MNMKKFALLFAALLLMQSTSSAKIVYVDDIGDGLTGTGAKSDPFRDLQKALDEAKSLDTVLIRTGNYISKAYAVAETLCGNCEKQKTPVRASRGFLIHDKSLIIIGANPDSTTLMTNAGYGVYFLKANDSIIKNVKITGGVRDMDGSATDAGIVVQWGQVTIEKCVISDNTNRPESVVVGIGGIMGREGAELFILNNRIENNTWDGIALYRGATAYIADNIINGGRGAGIGLTWDANAIVLRNRVSNYWKGIGSFGDSRVTCANNSVFDNLGWGIIATGTSHMDATNNVVYHNGNCGMAIWGDDVQGRFSNNIVVNNGWRDQWVCPCVGIWNYGSLFNFDISYNDVWNNKAGEYGDMPDYSEKNGNLKIDPKFDSLDVFILSPSSPLINKGNPLLSDPDGTQSDIGVTGGPHAKR